MIHVICGLVGSGKSTYARQHYRHIVELEKYKSKDRQIAKARKLHELGRTVAYITCYPTAKEMEFLDSIEADQIRWFLVDTDVVQCRRNILKRGRKSDADVIRTRTGRNAQLMDRIARSGIKFEKISLFKSGERW